MFRSVFNSINNKVFEVSRHELEKTLERRPSPTFRKFKTA